MTRGQCDAGLVFSRLDRQESVLCSLGETPHEGFPLYDHISSPISLSPADIVRRTELFKALGDDEIEALAAQLEWVSVPADEVLFEKGDPGDSLFILVSGRLEAFDPDDKGPRTSWGYIMPGQVVGEMAIIQGDKRLGTVQA